MTARVKHPVYGWGCIVEVLMVHEADGRLKAGDVSILHKADDQHPNEDPRHCVVDASMPVEGIGEFAKAVQAFANDCSSLADVEPFCACGRVVSRCDGSRKGCGK